MKEYKMIIADDESNIRNAISRMIDWKAERVIVCGGADNGRDALRLIEEYDADIALLDIQMPVMTGLEVIARLKKLDLHTKAIIISGYDDFAFAREALVNGAVNYLLKPCRPEEILEAVAKAKEAIDREKKEKEEELIRQEKWLARKREIHNKNVFELLMSRDEDTVTKCERMLDFQIKCKVLCLLIRPISQEKWSEEAGNYIVSLIEETFSAVAGIVGGNIAAAVNKTARMDKKEFRELLIEIKQKVQLRYHVQVGIGVGNFISRDNGLVSSYQNAQKALGMIHFIGTDFILFYDSIYRTDHEEYPIQIETELLESLKKQNAVLCSEKLDEFFDAAMQDNHAVLRNGVAILLSLYHFALAAGLDADKIFGRPLDLIDNIIQTGNTAELKEKMKGQCGSIMEMMCENQMDNRFVNAAVQYIRQNYNKDISLTMVAEEIFITPGYLSTLFKQVVGESLISYLNRVRIEKACEYLKDVRLKTYEISYKVGFQDEKYFTKVFRKIMEKSPSQYRKELI